MPSSRIPIRPQTRAERSLSSIVTAQTSSSPSSNARSSSAAAASLASPLPQLSGCSCQPISISPSPFGRGFSSTVPAGTPVDRSTTAHDPKRGSCASRAAFRSISSTARDRSWIAEPANNLVTAVDVEEAVDLVDSPRADREPIGVGDRGLVDRHAVHRRRAVLVSLDQTLPLCATTDRVGAGARLRRSMLRATAVFGGGAMRSSCPSQPVRA
jgi:hypothetical protein